MSKSFFLDPIDPMHKRYEALRASFVDDLSAEQVAKKFNYSVHTINALRKDFKAGTLPPFFNPLTKGPKERRPSSLKAKGRIIELRKQNYSIEEIEELLLREQFDITAKTISKILKDEGFARLFRRTHAEKRLALQQAINPPEMASVKDFSAHRFVKTAYGGVFLFIPMIIDMQLDKIFNQVGFYGSKQIPRLNYLMSFLALKLIGKERLSHVNDLNFDYGLGTFAGLNVLPNVAAITRYSYRNPHNLVVNLLKKLNHVLKKKGCIKGDHINLDFHSTPHWGEESQLQKNWGPIRGKAMKSVLCFFAQDLDTTYLCYSNGQMSKQEAPDEILNFVSCYQSSHGVLPNCLVFDSKLTHYKNLNVLDKDFSIKFISLQRRGKKILDQINKISDWKKIRLNKTTREFKSLKIYEQPFTIKHYDRQLRQIVVTGIGRQLPMLIITNEFDSPPKEIIETYAARWIIENNIQENVDFFSLNALSSPVIVKVDFDIAVTLIANTLYKTFAAKFKLFGKAKPKTIYRNIIESAARIYIESLTVKIIFGKKAFNPLIMDWIRSLPEIRVPWMENRVIQYDFE